MKKTCILRILPLLVMLAASPAKAGDSCPEIRFLDSLTFIHHFQDPANPKPSEEISAARMTAMDYECNIVNGDLAIDLFISFDGLLGPKARVHKTDKPSFSYPYFVAISKMDGTLLSKEILAVGLRYDSQGDTQSTTESIRQVIPAASRNDGPYRVMVGFQLSDDELAFNRIYGLAPAAGP